MADLESTVLMSEAVRAIQGISKQDLQVLKSLVNPPAIVKLVLESVMLLLGVADKAADWRRIRQFITQADFLQQLISFDPDTSLSEELLDKFTKQYLENPDYVLERAVKANRTAAALMVWARATVNNASMLEQVQWC